MVFVLNPQTPKLLRSPLLSFPPSSSLSLSSLRTLKFPTIPYSTPLHYSFNHDVEDDHVVGDCLVFEEGVFEDPGLDPNPNPKSTVAETENLVPEEWREVQAEINISKKERRRIAQELELNSRVERKRKGLDPIRNVNLEAYESYREAKAAHLKPLLDNKAGEVEEVKVKEIASERVAPKNPRWAVYGRRLDDVTEFFNSGNYDPGQMDSKGSQKLFSREEKVLLNKRIPDLAIATSRKWMFLHTLAASGEYYLMSNLLKHDVDINAVDVDGLTALHKAIIAKKQAITSFLLRESADPFVRDPDGATLMHYAVQTASIPAIRLLLLYNVDINLQDNDGWTPLHLAIQARRTDIVKLLLIKGADKTIRNKDGLTALDLCLHCGRDTRTYELVKLLKELPKTSTSRKFLS